MVVLDNGGRVIRPALLWNDTRSARAAADLISEFGAAELARRTGSVPVASFTVTKMTIADKNYFGGSFENTLKDGGLTLLRPTRKGEKPRPGTEFFQPLRQIIESVNDTLKGQLDLEAHGRRTIAGVTIRVMQRILALTAAIWHNSNTGQRHLRSLIAYDH